MFLSIYLPAAYHANGKLLDLPFPLFVQMTWCTLIEIFLEVFPFFTMQNTCDYFSGPEYLRKSDAEILNGTGGE